MLRRPALRWSAAALLVLTLAAVGPAACPAGGERAARGEGGQQGGVTRTLRVGGLERTYLYFLPAGHDPSRPTPVILAFHGARTRTATFVAITGLHRDAGRAGYLVVYPTGIGRSWNVGACCGPAQAQGVDDLAFVRALLADLGSVARVDPRRVYATGFSNGGMLSYRLACELPDRIAAIAPVGGTSAGAFRCDAPRPVPVPVLHMHGALDEWARVEGGVGRQGLPQPSVAEITGYWRGGNRCTTPPAVVYDQRGARCVQYAGCARGAEVEVCTVRDLGHQWPGGRVALPRIYGPGSDALDGNARIIAFFNRHALPATP